MSKPRVAIVKTGALKGNREFLGGKFVRYEEDIAQLKKKIAETITLAVGGIGVANIMYIVVQERTREIGVKRAVGARRWDIMSQFFAETLFIIGLGSALGFLIAAGIIEGMQYIPIKEFIGTPELSVEVALVTMGVLCAIGLAAGLMPARRAANLNIVDCLRT